MSWWDPSGLSTFATQALKTAQKRIDKVLDIEVEDGDDEARPCKEALTTHDKYPLTCFPELLCDANACTAGSGRVLLSAWSWL